MNLYLLNNKMNSHKDFNVCKGYIFKFIKLFFFLTPFIFSSCLKDYNNSGAGCDLFINVTGMTGRPRENIKVTLYSSREDAESKSNQLGEGYTDRYGAVEIQNLKVGQAYWVRAQALLTKRIKSTSNLSYGTNYFHIKIL